MSVDERGDATGGPVQRVDRLSSKQLITKVADDARGLNWGPADIPEGATVVSWYAESVLWMYLQLSGWTHCALLGRSRGERRKARRVAHALGKALVDCKQDRARVEDVADGAEEVLIGVTKIALVPGKTDTAELMFEIGRRMYLMSLLADNYATTVRASIMIKSLTRLGDRLETIGCVPPVARVRGGARRGRVAPDRDERGDKQVSLVREGQIERETFSSDSVEGEHRPLVADAPDPPPPSRTRGEDAEDEDGWD